MNFKPNALPTNILPTYINIIEGIIFYKNQKTKQKIKDYIFIKKVSKDIIEMWEKASIENVGYKSSCMKIKKLWEHYIRVNKDTKNKNRNNLLYLKCNKLLDISKNTINLSKEDYNFLIDQQNERKMLIGNLKWSKGGMFLSKYIILNIKN